MLGVKKFIRPVIYIIAIVLHLAILFNLTVQTPKKQKKEDTTIFKVVDVQEFQKPEPEPEKEKPKKKKEPPPPPPKEETVEVETQETIAETVTETEKTVVEVEKKEPKQIDYLPQHKISKPPKIPTGKIRSQIQYPRLANMQKIEGVVFLELFIDTNGKIRNIKVLKDPGYGLAEAALKALENITCKPAMANDKAVAVRFRYPIRFALK